MARARFLLLFLAIAAGLGWLSLRKPHSPSDDLPMVTVAAFEFEKLAPGRGPSVAEEAKGWPGVTAASFNESSGLLGATFTAQLSEKEMAGKLTAAAGVPASRKIFPEPTGAKCPVPAAFLAKLPGRLMGLSAVAAALFALTFLSFSRKKI